MANTVAYTSVKCLTPYCKWCPLKEVVCPSPHMLPRHGARRRVIFNNCLNGIPNVQMVVLVYQSFHPQMHLQNECLPVILLSDSLVVQKLPVDQSIFPDHSSSCFVVLLSASPPEVTVYKMMYSAIKCIQPLQIDNLGVM